MKGYSVDGMEDGGAPTMRTAMQLPSTLTIWETIMHEELNQTAFPELMTETELMHFLRIPDVSRTADPHHVVENLKRFHQLPCIHISRQPLYPLTAVRRWVEDKLRKECRP
jgi:hypothetical protein